MHARVQTYHAREKFYVLSDIRSNRLKLTTSTPHPRSLPLPCMCTDVICKNAVSVVSYATYCNPVAMVTMPPTAVAMVTMPHTAVAMVTMPHTATKRAFNTNSNLTNYNAYTYGGDPPPTPPPPPQHTPPPPHHFPPNQLVSYLRSGMPTR